MFRYLAFTEKVDITITGYNPFHFAHASAETVSIFAVWLASYGIMIL